MSASAKSPTSAWRGPGTASTSTCTTPASPGRSASRSMCSLPTEVKAIWPLCETDGLIGAIQHPDDGYIQPADLTQALARGARTLGAEINRNTAVTAIERTPAGEWLVRTDKGDITAEHVVSATGNFARLTGAMVGLDVPVLPVEHQYIVTEPHPAVVARRRPACPRWACSARATRPGICARRTAASCSAPTRRARRPAMSTGRRRTPNTSSSRRTSTVSRRTSRRRSPASLPSARSASRRSTTAPSPIRPTAARSSARRRGCRTSG